MTNVNDLDKMITALMEYGQSFFHGCRTKTEVYGRFVLAFNQLAKGMEAQRAAGTLEPALAEAWSWYSIAMPAMVKVMWLGDPKFGTRELEQQLNDAFVESLRKSKTTTLRPEPATPAPAPPRSVIDVSPPDTPPPKAH